MNLSLRNPLLKFLREAHSEQDGLGSNKRLLFSAAVLTVSGLLIFDVWQHKGFRAESISIATILVGATAGAYGITQFAK